MRVDAYLPKSLAASLHSLLLTLMADQGFKVTRAQATRVCRGLDALACPQVTIAEAYTAVYPALTHRFARGVGLADHALYTLSVQFLNRDQFVDALVDHHALLPTLAHAVGGRPPRAAAARAQCLICAIPPAYSLKRLASLLELAQFDGNIILHIMLEFLCKTYVMGL